MEEKQMNTRKLVITLAVCLTPTSVGAAGAEYCAQINRQAKSGGFAKFANDMVKDALCKATLFGAEECFRASFYLLGEFKRRLPDHDPREVKGLCVAD
jgi:hypothetical protein